jgi:hypothetical protein
MAVGTDAPAPLKAFQREDADRCNSSRGNISVKRNMIIKTVSRDRSKIVLEQEDQIKHWIKHLGVTRDELVRVVAKVGNSAAAVRKEFAAIKK